MPVRRSSRFQIAACLACTAVAFVLDSNRAEAQLGHSVAGVGPINRSMGGASVAAPLDAAGALFWNPATIGALGRSEIEFGAELLMPRSTLASRIGVNTFAPGVPPVPLRGSTKGDNGAFPLPAFGLVYREDDSAWAYGIGFFGVAGFSANYPASRTNPILMPQAPFGRGFGPLYSQYLMYQLSPSVALRLTDELTVGLSANIDLGLLSVDPAPFAPPSLMPTPLGSAPVYPPATHGRPRWGGGFQVGFYYDPGNDWRFGASLKSPQWFESYQYFTTAADGSPASFRFNLDYPLVASVGTSYTGIDRLLVAWDVRFLNFRDSDGFRSTGFDTRGAALGVGWQNVLASALGVQYQWTEALSLRAGYTFSLNPAGGAVTMFNIASPTIIQHSVAVGASYNVTNALKVSAAYVHYFENTIEGPLVAPFVGSVPGGTVRTSAAADSVVLGVSVGF